MFGRRVSLVQTYGVEYTPDDLWTIGGGFESGLVRDDTIDGSTGLQRADFSRNAGSLAATFENTETGTRGKLRGEARFEDSEDKSRNYNTYLFAGSLSWKTNPDWRILGSLDTVITQGKGSGYWGGHYVETSLGYAYRPVENDRWSGLFKYTYLQDEPSSGQVSAVTGTTHGIDQRSNILSADVNYDLFPWLTIGGKYGLRVGEIRDREDFETRWEQSIAQLFVARADVHVIDKWDLLAEGRVLNSPTADTTDYGALLAAYRHVGGNFKVGVGYNFGRFSDELQDLTLDDQGAFLNVIAKY